MKISVVVIEADVDKWNAKGPPYIQMRPDQRFRAMWRLPDGGTITSDHCGSKDEALESLRDGVRKYLACTMVRSVEEVEIDV